MGRGRATDPARKPGGNKRLVDICELVNGLMYILSTGCQWRAIPRDLAPRRTVYDYMDRWSGNGTLEQIHHALYVKCREQALQKVSPTAAVIDSQGAKIADLFGVYPFLLKLYADAGHPGPQFRNAADQAGGRSGRIVQPLGKSVPSL